MKELSSIRLRRTVLVGENSEDSIEFKDLKSGMVFKLYEDDGTPVKDSDGAQNYVAAEDPFLSNGVWGIKCSPIKHPGFVSVEVTVKTRWATEMEERVVTYNMDPTTFNMSQHRILETVRDDRTGMPVDMHPSKEPTTLTLSGHIMSYQKVK